METTSKIQHTTLLSEPAGPTLLKDPPLKQYLWAQALGELSESQRSIVLKHHVSERGDVVESLINVARERRDECDRRRLKIEIGGKTFIVRDLMGKIIVWVDKFKSVGDVAVNFDPVHAALPWAGIRFLLHAIVGDANHQAGLVLVIEKASYLIARCRLYELLHLYNPVSVVSPSSYATRNLEASLQALYTTILRFLAEACATFSKNKTSRILNATFTLDTTASKLIELEQLESRVEREVQVCESTETQEDRKARAEFEGQARVLLQELNSPVRRTSMQVQQLCASLNETERGKVLQWISNIPYRESHISAKKDRILQTGAWLLNDRQFQEWRNGSASMTLWLHGSPGTGKTKLVSKVVDHVIEFNSSQVTHEAFAYFYCDRYRDDYRNPDYIIASFVRQLSTRPQPDTVPDSILGFYDRERVQGFPSGSPDFDTCSRLLSELVAIYPQTIIVLDALDECDEDSRYRLTRVLRQLVEQSPSLVKVFISSRPDPDLGYQYRRGPNIEIQASRNEQDIKTYIEYRLNHAPSHWDRIVSADMKNDIRNLLMERAEAMFQWVALQVDQLFRLRRSSDIRDRLGGLPRTLKQAYDDVFKEIQNLDGSLPVIAVRAFHWIACSQGTFILRPDALVAAVCQDPERGWEEVDLDIDTVLTACRNLVKIDTEGFCRFSHLSVSEYFEETYASVEKSHCFVAEACLSLLNDPEYWKQKVSQSSRRNLFLIQVGSGLRPRSLGRKTNSLTEKLFQNYLLTTWCNHMQKADDRDPTGKLAIKLKRFLGSMLEPSESFKLWYDAVSRQCHGKTKLEKNYLHSLSHPLYVICAFGFYEILSDWWSELKLGSAPKIRDAFTLMELASAAGHVDIVKELHRRGEALEDENESFGSALLAACYTGREDVAKLLIEYGANIHAVGLAGNVLEALLKGKAPVFERDASFRRLLKLLLDSGAEANSGSTRYSRSRVFLHVAAYGSAACVELFLDHGAYINASDVSRDDGDSSSLQSACEFNVASVVKLLLDRGADINVKAKLTGSPLHAAVRNLTDSVNVIKLLLDRGADVNTASGQLGTPLHAAVLKCNHELVELLLNRNAEVDRLDKDGGATALQYAIFLSPGEWKHPSDDQRFHIVRLLIDHGADVNMQGSICTDRSPSFNDVQADALFSLLDQDMHSRKSGSESEAQSTMSYPTVNVLQLAALYGSPRRVQVLLDKGAKVYNKSDLFENAIDAALHTKRLIQDDFDLHPEMKRIILDDHDQQPEINRTGQSEALKDQNEILSLLYAAAELETSQLDQKVSSA